MEEEPKKTSGHQERKKAAVKIGGGGGGGGGGGAPVVAILLLGGALATAAFVSFIRKRGWRFGKDRCRRHQKENQRPETGEQDERDGSNEEENFVVLDKCSKAYENRLSSGETDLTVPKNASDSITQKSTVEINGVVGDAEPAEQSVVSNIHKILDNGVVSTFTEIQENGVVSGGSVFIGEGFHSLYEKLPAEPGNMIAEGETEIPLIKQDDSDESTKEIKGFDLIDDDKAKSVEKKMNEVAESGKNKSEEAIEGEETVLPVFEEGGLVTEIHVEKVSEDQVIEASHGACVEEQVGKQETSDSSDHAVIVLEKSDNVGNLKTEEINRVDKDNESETIEDAAILADLAKSEEPAEITEMKEEDEDMSSVQFVAVGEAEQQHKDNDKDSEHRADLSDEADVSSAGPNNISISSMEHSKLGQVRPAESLQGSSRQTKVIVAGKIQQDKNNDQAKTEECRSKYKFVGNLAKLTRQAVLIGAFSMLSAIFFLAMALSKIFMAK